MRSQLVTQNKGLVFYGWPRVKFNTLPGGLSVEATPLSARLLLAFAGTALRLGHKIFVRLLVVAFAAFLRAGELLSLRYDDVSLGRDGAVFFIPSSKGAKKEFLPLERIEIVENTALSVFFCLMVGVENLLWGWKPLCKFGTPRLSL